MPFCDLHIHSIRSTCGFHTLFEIVDIMKGKNHKAFALTDHSPCLATPLPHFSVMLRRLPKVIDGIRVFKGIEASILNSDGIIDLPVFEGYPYEIILAGLHNHDVFADNPDIEKHTQAVVNAMKNNPSVKVITHPYWADFPLDMDKITDAAAEYNIALEINNSYILNGKSDLERMAYMVELCKKKGTMLAVNSDGHVFNEMAEFAHSIEFLKPYGLENLNIVNRTFESTLEFLGIEE